MQKTPLSRRGMLTFNFRCVMIIVLGRSVLERPFSVSGNKKELPEQQYVFAPARFRIGNSNRGTVNARSLHLCAKASSTTNVRPHVFYSTADTHSLRQLTPRILPGSDHTCSARFRFAQPTTVYLSALPTHTACGSLPSGYGPVPTTRVQLGFRHARSATVWPRALPGTRK